MTRGCSPANDRRRTKTSLNVPWVCRLVSAATLGIPAAASGSSGSSTASGSTSRAASARWAARRSDPWRRAVSTSSQAAPSAGSNSTTRFTVWREGREVGRRAGHVDDGLLGPGKESGHHDRRAPQDVGDRPDPVGAVGRPDEAGEDPPAAGALGPGLDRVEHLHDPRRLARARPPTSVTDARPERRSGPRPPPSPP